MKTNSIRILNSLLVFAILSIPLVSGQEFQKAFTEFNIANDISRDQVGNLYLGGYSSYILDPNLQAIISRDIINKLDAGGNELWSREFSYNDLLTEILATLTLPNGDVVILFSHKVPNQDRNLGLSRISSTGSIVWSKDYKMDIVDFDQFSPEANLLIADGDNFLVQGKKVNSKYQVFSLSKFTSTGEMLWTKTYPLELKINESKMVAIDRNRKALIGHHTLSPGVRHGFIFIIDENGKPIISKSFANLQIIGVIPDGISFILKTKSTINEHMGILKVNSDLTKVIWSLEMNFEIEGQIGNIEKFEDDIFVVYGYDFRKRQELLASFDLDGNFIWGKYLSSKYSGRPLNEKIINASNQILLLSHIWSNDAKTSILRQIPLDGKIEDCILSDACPKLYNLQVKSQVIRLPQSEFQCYTIPIDITLTPINRSTLDFCQEDGLLPTALFELDTTACINEAVFITNTNSSKADRVSWDAIVGPENDDFPIPNADEDTPIVFPEDGNYTITQSVEFNNCISTHSQVISVALPVPFTFEDKDLLLCENEIKTIDVSNAGIEKYIWQDDQSESPIREIDKAGVYTVQVSDSHCKESHDITVKDFDYSTIYFDLGTDTTLCSDKSYTISASNINHDVEYLWHTGFSGNEIEVTKEGKYILTSSKDGCKYEDEVYVKFESCDTKIYIPNIFSPNGDGINDTFYPLGVNFEMVDFRIYDRWGELVHASNTPWDGIYRNKLNEGTYVYVAKFRNLLTEVIENTKGNIYLDR